MEFLGGLKVEVRHYILEGQPHFEPENSHFEPEHYPIEKKHHHLNHPPKNDFGEISRSFSRGEINTWCHPIALQSPSYCCSKVLNPLAAAILRPLPPQESLPPPGRLVCRSCLLRVMLATKGGNGKSGKASWERPCWWPAWKLQGFRLPAALQNDCSISSSKTKELFFVTHNLKI